MAESGGFYGLKKTAVVYAFFADLARRVAMTAASGESRCSTISGKVTRCSSRILLLKA